ncbi:MAG TPA: hypothetical protein VHC69_04725 [Polyangiaceae bacterium]|nr:hypothetical protein [Polyangiaceae bacterium]
MVQGVLTVVAEVSPAHLPALVSLLAELDAALDGQGGPPVVDFRALETVHFARFVVLPPNAAGKTHLAFSVAYDGPLNVHIDELVVRAGDGLCTVFAHCTGFPESASAANDLRAYLTARAIPYGAMHVGYVGRTMSDVRREEALRRFIGQTLDAAKISTLPTPERPARVIRKEVIDLVAKSEFRWALEPRAAKIAPSGVEGWWKGTAAVLVGVAALAVAIAAAFAVGHGVAFVVTLVGGSGVAGALVVALLRRAEETDPAKTDTDIARGLANAEDEDYGVTNQLTHVAAIKPGAFRMFVLRGVLFTIELRARLQFWRGDLGGIETIHCAHWAILHEEQPRLLFCSNYDGSWERYLGDFIEEAGAGMTAVWSNTVNFPKTRFLIDDGAKNERVFKAWTRENQVRTDVWYRANPDISCRNLNDNSKLRDGLRGYMAEADARDWLRYL